MDALHDISEKYNRRINTKKTKITRMSTVERRTMKIRLDRIWKELNNFVTSEVWRPKTVKVVTKLESELVWEKRLSTRKVTSCENPSIFT